MVLLNFMQGILFPCASFQATIDHWSRNLTTSVVGVVRVLDQVGKLMRVLDQVGKLMRVLDQIGKLMRFQDHLHGIP